MGVTPLGGLLREDGAVVVPPGLAAAVLRVLALELAGEARAVGGALTPAARDLLVALDEASQRPQAPADLVIADPEVAGVSVAEAATRMGCTRQWVRYLLGAGRLAGRRVSGVWVVHIGPPLAPAQVIPCDAPE